MTTYRRLRGERLLAASLLLALAPPSFAAEVTLRLLDPGTVPETVWVAPVEADGRTGAPRALAPLPPDGSAMKSLAQARYQGELAPGAWRVVGVAMDRQAPLGRLEWLLPPVRASVPDAEGPTRGVVSLVAGGADFEVPADAGALDLGVAALLGDGNVSVLDRRAGEAGWRAPVMAHEAQPDLAALRAAALVLLRPLRIEGAGLVAMTTDGRLAIGRAGDWRPLRGFEDAQAIALLPIEDGVLVLGREGALARVRADAGLERLPTAGLPPRAPIHAECSAAMRCVAEYPAEGGGEGREVFETDDARVGPWRPAAAPSDSAPPSPVAPTIVVDGRSYRFDAGRLMVADASGAFAVDATLLAALAPDAPRAAATRRPAERPAAVEDASRVVALAEEHIGMLRAAIDLDVLAQQRGPTMLASHAPVLPDFSTMPGLAGASPTQIAIGGGLGVVLASALLDASAQADLQRFADQTLEPVTATLEQGLEGAVGAGVQDALLRNGRDGTGLLFLEDAGEQHFDRVRVRGTIRERLLIRPAPWLSRIATTPVAMAQDWRHLRIAIDITRLEGAQRPYGAPPTRPVAIVIEAPLGAETPTLPEAWAVDGARPLRHAVRDAIAAAVELSLAEPIPYEPADAAPIDLLLSTGVERVQGVLLERRGPDLLIGLPDRTMLRIEARLVDDVVGAEASR